MLPISLEAKLILALIIHEMGDYVLQSDWMASKKTTSSFACLCHAVMYTLGFILVVGDPVALGIIGGSHFLIDRFRLARYVCWLKNFLSPRSTPLPAELWIEREGELPVVRERWWHPWEACSKTGYPEGRPPWMTVWLMIRADAVMHLSINFAVIYLAHTATWWPQCPWL